MPAELSSRYTPVMYQSPLMIFCAASRTSAFASAAGSVIANVAVKESFAVSDVMNSSAVSSIVTFDIGIFIWQLLLLMSEPYKVNNPFTIKEKPNPRSDFRGLGFLFAPVGQTVWHVSMFGPHLKPKRPAKSYDWIRRYV
ncbi:hypothetical protein D3C71_1403820 [compost metagenome]